MLPLNKKRLLQQVCFSMLHYQTWGKISVFKDGLFHCQQTLGKPGGFNIFIQARIVHVDVLIPEYMY